MGIILIKYKDEELANLTHMPSKSIDIIIPSFRLEEKYLLPLIHLAKPSGWLFNYFIVVDNPSIHVPAAILELARAGRIQLFINEQNMGASASRNKGIDAGQSEWILFIDDDVIADQDLLFVYTQAIENNPNEIGFIGLTDFPPPSNHFTSALQAGELTFFKIAASKDYFPWGVTANMMYNRSSMQELRFSQQFPKSGGGEDVDLPLRICQRHHQSFKCVKDARVVHPWWNDGKTHYDRFIRYGIGVGYLLPRHPPLTWRDFPNTMEAFILLFISFPFFLFLGQGLTWLLLGLAIPVIDYFSMYLKARSLGVKSLKTIYYMTLLKNSFDLGILKAILKEKKPRYFMTRINIGDSRTSNFRLNRWKIMRISLFIILFIGLALI